MAYTLTYSKIKNKNEYAIVGYTGDLDDPVIPATYEGLPVTQLSAGCFEDCLTLITLVVPSTILTIEQGCLSGCYNLHNLTLPFVGKSFVEQGKANRYPFGYIFGKTQKPRCRKTEQHFVGPLLIPLAYNAYIPNDLRYVYITGEGCPYVTNYAFQDCKTIQVLRIGEAVNYFDYRSFESIGYGGGAAAIGGYVATTGPRAVINGGNITARSTGLGAAAIGSDFSNYDADTGPINQGLLTFNNIEVIETKVFEDQPYYTTPANDYKYLRNPFIKVTANSVFTDVPTGGTAITTETTDIGSGVYYVDGKVQIEHTLGINGNVHLVLKPNSELKITHITEVGISVRENCKLTIWAEEPQDGEALGKLNIRTYSGKPAIFCGNGRDIEINGGDINLIADGEPRGGVEKLILECKNMNGVPGELRFAFAGYAGERIGEFHFKGTPDEYISGFVPFFSKTGSLPSSMSHNIYFDGEEEATAPTQTININAGKNGEVTEWAFEGCKTIKSVILSDDITTVSVKAFHSCECLSYVDLGDNLTTIYANAFNRCSSLEEIFIPHSVTTMGSGVFDNDAALTIYIDFDRVPGSWASDWNPDNLPVITIRSNLQMEFIALKGYYSCIGRGESSSETIYIPSAYDDGTNGVHSVCEIGESAFINDAVLRNIHLPDTILAINARAFENCEHLHGVYLPNNTEYSIGDYAFYKCPIWPSQTVSRIDPLIIKAASIGAYAFAETNTYRGGYLQELTIENEYADLGSHAFYGNEYLLRLDFYGEKIGASAFEGCELLGKIYIKHLEPIEFGENAFKYRYTGDETGLVNYYPVDATTSDWGYHTFANADANPLTTLHNLYFGPNKINTIELSGPIVTAFAFSGWNGGVIGIRNALTTIEGNAFLNCENVSKITIPANVRNIGAGAFLGCNKLTITCQIQETSKPVGWVDGWNGGRPVIWLPPPDKIIKNLTIFGEDTYKWEGRYIRRIVYNGVGYATNYTPDMSKFITSDGKEFILSDGRIFNVEVE